MTRALSSTDSAQATSAVVGVVEFLEIDLPSGNLYLTSAPKAYTWNGNTYSPTNGQWGAVGNYNETVTAVPRPMSLTLSGVDQTLIGNLVGTSLQWVPIVYSLGFTDASANLLDNPTFTAPLFFGDCTIRLTQNGGTIQISAENLLADMQNRNSGMLQTNTDQQARFAGDTFFQNIASLINKVIYWGQLGPMQIGTSPGGTRLDSNPGPDPFFGIKGL